MENLELPECRTSSLHMCAPVRPCSLHKAAASLLHRHQRAPVPPLAEGEVRNRIDCCQRGGVTSAGCAARIDPARCGQGERGGDVRTDVVAPHPQSTSTCSSTGMRQRPTRISGELGAPGCRPRPRCRAGGAGRGRAGGAGRAPSTPGCPPGAGSGWRSRGGTRLWMSQALGRFGSHCSSAATVVWNRSLVMVCPIVWPHLPWAVAARSLPAIRSARRWVESGQSMVGSKVRQPWAGCGGLGWIGPASVVAVPAARAGNASERGRSADRSDRSHCPITGGDGNDGRQRRRPSCPRPV